LNFLFPVIGSMIKAEIFETLLTSNPFTIQENPKFGHVKATSQKNLKICKHLSRKIETTSFHQRSYLMTPPMDKPIQNFQEACVTSKYSSNSMQLRLLGFHIEGSIRLVAVNKHQKYLQTVTLTHVYSSRRHTFSNYAAKTVSKPLCLLRSD